MKTKNYHFLKIHSVFLFALLLFPMAGRGQTVSTCFNLEKLKKMYASTFIEINTMLLNESWEIITNATQTPFVFGNDSLIYDNFSQWKNELSVDKLFVSQYRKKGLFPVLTLQTSKTCYETIESELQKNSSISQRIVKDSVQQFHIFQVQPNMDIVFLPRKSRQPYIIAVCNHAQIDSLIRTQNAEKEEYEKTLQDQQQAIQNALDQVDLLRKSEDYATAIHILEQAMNQPFLERDELVIEAQEVKNKINVVKKELDTKNFNFHVQIANSAFANENYAMAKEELLQALQIDASSPVVLQKLKEIEKIEQMIIIRKDSVFHYALYNKKICDEIQTDIFKKLKNYFLNISAGDIEFSYKLYTDLTGQNISSYQINTFSLRPAAKLATPVDTEEAWSSFLEKLLINRPIPAVKIDYLYVNAATTFQNQSSWKSSLVKVSNGGKKVKISPYNTLSAEKRTLETFFKANSSFPKGKYTIEKKNITYQDSLYTTLTLTKIYTVGPEAMLYSMLFPGAGSLAATQGKKGWGAFSTFIIFGGIGVAGYVVSEKVKLPDNNTSLSTADIIKYASFGSLGIAGVIYISDIFVALKRGINNLKKTRTLKETLKENAIYIQEFPH